MKAANRKLEPPTVLELLIQHGASVNARDKGGDSALLLAEQEGNAEAIAVLRAAGAKE
jgi:ankyrin repeat protein